MISGPSSYLPTLDEFLAHWAAVNADPLATSGLLTRDGKNRAALAGLRAALVTAGDSVLDRLNGKEIERARVENAKRNILLRSQELGRRLRGVLPMDSPFLKALPELPTLTSAQEVFLAPIRDFANVWKRLADDGTEIVLADNYTRATHEGELSVLAGLYTTLNAATLDLKIAREKRNILQTEARTVLSSYRPAVEGLFPPDSPLVKTIPIIYPPAGHTPDSVVATATYDAATNEAVITFSESAEAELEFYQVRGVPGPEYDGDDEAVIATIPKGAPRQVRTTYSLAQLGNQASFKVYVVLKTGNEAGSNAVTVMRV
jgi:hypothetical protein